MNWWWIPFYIFQTKFTSLWHAFLLRLTYVRLVSAQADQKIVSKSDEACRWAEVKWECHLQETESLSWQSNTRVGPGHPKCCWVCRQIPPLSDEKRRWGKGQARGSSLWWTVNKSLDNCRCAEKSMLRKPEKMWPHCFTPDGYQQGAVLKKTSEPCASCRSSPFPGPPLDCSS